MFLHYSNSARESQASYCQAKKQLYFWMCNIMYNTEHNLRCQTSRTFLAMLQETLTGFEINWILNVDLGNRNIHPKIIQSCLCNPNRSECMKKTMLFNANFLYFVMLKLSSATAEYFGV